MTLIVYGKTEEMFVTEIQSVPDAIIELYEYTKGGLDEDLFSKAIYGMQSTASVGDMVRLFNATALDAPIGIIYTNAKEYWRADDG